MLKILGGSGKRQRKGGNNAPLTIEERTKHKNNVQKQLKDLETKKSVCDRNVSVMTAKCKQYQSDKHQCTAHLKSRKMEQERARDLGVMVDKLRVYLRTIDTVEMSKDMISVTKSYRLLMPGGSKTEEEDLLNFAAEGDEVAERVNNFTGTVAKIFSEDDFSDSAQKEHLEGVTEQNDDIYANFMQEILNETTTPTATLPARRARQKAVPVSSKKGKKTGRAESNLSNIVDDLT